MTSLVDASASDVVNDVTFADLGLPAEIIEQLDRSGISSPFPIQTAVIPDTLAGRDVAGRAPTGSGKTLGFGLPRRRRADQGQAEAPRRPRARPDP